jgi:hypothetical protein
MWEDLGMDLESHDMLCQVLPDAVGDVFMSQENRPKAMDFWDLVISEVHGIRPAELIEEQKKGRKVFGTFCVFVPDEVISSVMSKMRPEEKKILIIHSQFAANELRHVIRQFKGIDATSEDVRIDCATFFMQSPDYMEKNDFRIENEDELYDIAAKGTYDLIIGDSDIKPMLKAARYRGGFIDYPHFAVSGRMFDESIS